MDNNDVGEARHSALPKRNRLSSAQMARCGRRHSLSRKRASTISSDLEARIVALQDVIDELPEQIALCDASWKILTVNLSWARNASESVRRELAPGRNFLEVLEDGVVNKIRDCEIVVAALREMATGTRRSLEHVYTEAGGDRDYRLVISVFNVDGSQLATITRHEITQLAKLTRQNRHLETSLLRVQMDERRRIGRDLHDSVAQHIVALQLSTLRLKNMHRGEESAALFADVEETLNRMNEEIRGMSYLLHPPTLNERGLVEAIDTLACGFARRTRLQISFGFDGLEEVWDVVIQTALYRVLQEALTNVHRHARAERVAIRLVAKPGKFLHLIIEDNGIGIPDTSLSTIASPGVGIAGMQSRIHELGGRFSFRRREEGMRLIASIPLSHRDLSDAVLPFRRRASA